MHDLVIDNAVVIDGLGGPARKGGAVVDGGRITVVGADLGPARQRIDAGGLVLAPGIVDIHTHYDAQLTWDPFATPSTALGVTTVVIVHHFGHWVRERGDLTLPEAVKRVTDDVTRAYRIEDRGRLVPGAWADLLLFDPKTVGRGPKRRIHDLPSGAFRLDTPAVGVHGVWVNGVRTVDERGVIATCGRPGRLLRRFAA